MKSVLKTFWLTRGFVLVVFMSVPMLKQYEQDGYRYLTIQGMHPIASLQTTVATADAIWYESIFSRGYDRQLFEVTPHNWGFFPLFPLIIRLLHLDYYIAGTVVSNILFLGCLFLMYLVGQSFGFTSEQSKVAVWYLAIFPTSYFFSLPFTESLFFFLTLGSVYFALKDRWLFAGIAGALSTATRPPGILIVMLLAGIYWEQKRTIGKDILWLGAVPLGLLAFMAYIWHLTGNPLGAVQSQNSRDAHGVFFLRPIINFVLHPHGFAGWQFEPFGFAIAILMFVCIYLLLKRRQWVLAIYTFLMLIMPLSTNTLTSLPRYMTAVFPLYLVLARIGAEKTISFAFTFIFAILTVCCALHYTFAVC